MHDYFDKTYVTGWSENEIKKRPERELFFEEFVHQIKHLPKTSLSILEIGSGPGFLAERLLTSCSIKRYFLFDLSPFMLELSLKRLARFTDKEIHYNNGDFKKPDWFRSLPKDFDYIVSLQAIHEVGNVKEITRVCKNLNQLLKPSGLILLTDIVKSVRYKKAERLTATEYLQVLQSAGFQNSQAILTKKDLSFFRGYRLD